MAVTPVIEAGDCTVSGSNTESGSWAVSHPAAAFGDLLTFNVGWDDSTAVTSVTAPAGPNGEAAVSIEGPIASASTEVRGQAWYYIAEGAWASGTLTFTPSANESWTATVIKSPAGEFDAVSPIGANSSRASTGTAETTVLSPAFTAGASDGDGRLVWFGIVDADPLSATNPSGWTIRQRQDLGAVAHGIATRDAAVTNSESITAGSWGIAGDSWASIAYVVRAPVVGTTTLAPSSDSTDVDDWVDLVATVEYASTPVPGIGVTASSDDTAVAVAVVGTAYDYTTPGGSWGVAHSSPGGTSPLGSAITRATEDSSTTFHEGYWGTTDLALNAAMAPVFCCAEIKKPVGRDYVKLVLDDGSAAGGITFNCATGAVASTISSLGAIEYGARDLGSDWWLLWLRCTPDSIADVTIAVGANNNSFSSYAGDGATYCDIGYVGSVWPDVTDASGEVTVRVIGRDTGSADITATALADSSSASTVTVGATAAELVGAAAVAGAAAGALTTQIKLAAASVASVSSAGALSTGVRLEGAAASATLSSGVLTATITLQGAAFAAAASSAGMATAIQLAAGGQAGASGTGALTGVAAALAGDASAGAQAIGALTIQIRLAGDALAAALASGVLSSGVRLASASAMAAAAQGSLSTEVRLAGGAIAGALAAGELQSAAQLATAALASALATGDLATAVRLAGAALASGAAAGQLSGVAAALAADASVLAIAEGGVATAIRLDGAAAGLVQSSGALDVAIRLSASASAAALAAGVLSAQIRLDGAALAGALASVDLTGGTPVVPPVDRTIAVRAQPRRFAVRASTRRVPVLHQPRRVAVRQRAATIPVKAQPRRIPA